jgi:hypothetical protein
MLVRAVREIGGLAARPVTSEQQNPIAICMAALPHSAGDRFLWTHFLSRPKMPLTTKLTAEAECRTACCVPQGKDG